MATPAEREQIARGAGFPSYEAMALFYGQRNRAREQQTVRGNPIMEAMPAPVQQAASHAFDWHPASIFNRITEALRGANAQAGK